MNNNIDETKEGLSPHFNRGLDFAEGDVVQLGPGGAYGGRIGQIIAIHASEMRHNDLSYFIKLSDDKSVAVYKERIRLLRAAGSDVLEENSQFFDL